MKDLQNCFEQEIHNKIMQGRFGFADHRGKEMSRYLFEKTLIRGILLKRNSQFTATVVINDEMVCQLSLKLFEK